MGILCFIATAFMGLANPITGNRLATYSADDLNRSDINWTEQTLYGSELLGSVAPNINPQTPNPADSFAINSYTTYYLKNYKSDIMTLLSDRKYATGGSFSPIIVSATDRYAYGGTIAERTYNIDKMKYGFGSFENLKELNANNDVINFGDYGGMDLRTGRRPGPEPLTQKYPNLSPYAVFANNPVLMTDLDGRDIVFVNGFSPHDNNSQFNGGSLDWWRKTKYWNSENKNFTTNVENYFNDHKTFYLSASQDYGSKAADRQRSGYETALAMVESGQIKLSADNPITVVMHSQGNAYGAGYMQGVLHAGKERGLDVKVNGVMLSVHQPDDINTDNIKNRSIQFTYSNDNSIYVKPMGKIKDVADANPNNIANGKSGLSAHGATIDKNEAFEAIKNTDKQKDIYTKKK